MNYKVKLTTTMMGDDEKEDARCEPDMRYTSVKLCCVCA